MEVCTSAFPVLFRSLILVLGQKLYLEFDPVIASTFDCKQLWTSNVMYVNPPTQGNCIITQLQVSTTIPELSPDAATKIWEDTVNRISDLVHSQATFEKLGGILAIGPYMRAFVPCLFVLTFNRPSLGCKGGWHHRLLPVSIL